MFKVIKVGYFDGEAKGCIIEDSNLDRDGNTARSWCFSLAIAEALKSGGTIKGCQLDASGEVVFDDSLEKYELTIEEYSKYISKVENYVEEQKKLKFIEDLKKSINDDENLLQRYNTLKAKYDELKENYNSLLNTLKQG